MAVKETVTKTYVEPSTPKAHKKKRCPWFRKKKKRVRMSKSIIPKL
jgi:hypothetical protein